MKTLLIFLLITMGGAIYCQTNLKQLRPGDTLDKSIYNTSPGKWTILDFWGIFCTSCIESMPEMEALQKKFSDRLDIVFVTKFNDSDVTKLFKRVTIKKPQLTFINADSILSKVFPYLSMPHHVWIDPDGRVSYITQHYNATAKNVEKVLNGYKMNFAYKNENIRLAYDHSLLDQPEGNLNQHLETYSLFMDGLEECSGAFSTMVYDKEAGRMGLRITKSLLISIYAIAYGNSIYSSDYMLDNRVMIKTRAKDLFSKSIMMTQNSGSTAGIYSYESLLKTSSEKMLFERLRKDLRDNFHFEANIEMIKRRALVIRRTSSIDKLRSKSKQTSSKDIPGGGVAYTNQPFVDVVIQRIKWANAQKQTPVIDKTNYSGKVDMIIDADFANIRKLNEALGKYDLQIKEELIEVPMLVIKDAPR